MISIRSLRSPANGCRHTTRYDLPTHWAVWQPSTTNSKRPKPLLLHCPLDGEADVRSVSACGPTDRERAILGTAGSRSTFEKTLRTSLASITCLYGAPRS